MQARDIMTTPVVTVGTETPVMAVAHLLVERRISGVPVVDAENTVLGMISEGDLLRRAEIATEKQRSSWLELFVSGAQLASEYVQAHGRTADEIMNHEVVKVEPETPIATIVDIFERHGINRVPAVNDGKLVGIVSRGNLIQVLGSVAAPAITPSSEDRRIRDLVLGEFRKHPWGLETETNVVVTAGVVHLWGLVSTPEEQTALRVAAESITGVRRVEDHTILIHEHWHRR